MTAFLWGFYEEKNKNSIYASIAIYDFNRVLFQIHRT